jgi:hypothetical protein
MTLGHQRPWNFPHANLFLWGTRISAMSLTPEALYYQLGSLVAEIPDLATGPTTPETNQWIERAAMLVEMAGGLADKIQLRVATDNLDGMLRARNAQIIMTIVQRALIKAERNAPPRSQGAFIVANTTFDAFAAVRKVLTSAQAEVFLVDPHADAKVLTDLAVLAPDGVVVRLLADQANHKASLETATQRWMQKFGAARPLFVRLATAGTVQDTLILVDGATAWALGQSFSKLAKRTHTTLVRMPPETTVVLVAAYAARWDVARPLLDPS